jgi:hypothetical protein
MGFIDNSKNWFKRKMKPTEAQFSQVFDWLRWKDEEIATADITNLDTILNNKVDLSVFNAALSGGSNQEDIILAGDSSYHIERGWMLERAIIITPSDSDVMIGTAAGVDDIYPVKSISGSTPEVVTLNIYTEGLAGQNIYFTGTPAGTEVIFMKRKIKNF